MYKYEIWKNGKSILIGTSEGVREWLEVQLEDKLGFFVMLQENDDDEELEVYLHTDNYEDLSESNLDRLTQLSISEFNSVTSICQLLDIQILNANELVTEHTTSFEVLKNTNSNLVSKGELTREKLLTQCRSYFVPGHGPDFEKMTNLELENYTRFIEDVFEMAFSEDEPDDLEEDL